MSRFFTVLLCLFSLLLALTNCRKDTMDSYYARPDWLAQPIYQQLQSGQFGKDTVYSFKSFLACIDKAGYKSTLSAAGYYTIFAPTDEAFQSYFKDHNISSVSEIDSITAKKIVTYALVYNAYKKDRLADYQSSSTGWVPSMAYKRRTVYYKGFYRDTVAYNKYGYSTVIDCNRPLWMTSTSVGYTSEDNGDKYIPYFLQDVFTNLGLTASDYTTFFPTSTYTGFNVAGAKVVKADVSAENGYIHVIDKVITPLPNIEEYINSHPSKYSVFKDLLDYLAIYDPSPTASAKYLQLTGKSEGVRVKRYPYTGSSASSLYFAPNEENWKVSYANDAQIGGWSLYVPDDNAMKLFIKDKLKRYKRPQDDVARWQDVPIGVLTNFFNVHALATMAWPSKISSTNNVDDEPMSDMVLNSTITDPQLMSNGVFYGTNKVHESGLFYSVYGEVYLDPDYSMMTDLISLANVYTDISSKGSTYTIFMIPNSVFTSLGYKYDLTRDANYPWFNKYGVNGSVVNDTLKRIVKMHIYNGTPNFNKAGILKTLGGYVRYNGTTLSAVGNIDIAGNVKIPVTVTPQPNRTPNNGQVYTVDNLLTPAVSSKSIIDYLRSNPYYQKFYNLYLKSSINIERLLANDQNMILVPDPDAMDADAPSLSDPQVLIDRFIQYHIIPKNSFIPDNTGGGIYSTWLQTGLDPNKVTIINSDGKILQIQDEQGNIATVYNDFNRSYVLSKNTIIHQINKVLKYKN